MGRVAVFIDAGYFWVQSCHAVLGRPGKRSEVIVDYKSLRNSLLGAVGSQTNGVELLRVYWYDGPSQLGKGPDHQSIDELDDFKLRLGTRNMTGQQKAVDGLIIADMLNLTQSKAIDHAVLISGDADLTPGVTAAQAMGLRVHLIILEPKVATSPYLAAEADGKLYLTTDWIKSFAAQATVQAPIPGPVSPQPSVVTHSLPSVVPTTGSVTKSRLSCEEIARQTHASILQGPLASLLAPSLKGRVPLPPEIDRPLLYAGKLRLGKALTEDEKRDLRSAFKDLL
ncbi:NYN domain-containing protein [Acidicapsa acidisoli]|uniref:NYN domain-containing protein n=1 Tax=Acidicapsa acidisoli TaxID=1615681 RepID=UPI0021E0BC1D|nr:NYN domain-containing protein [Acidicapsa acidisoli]